DRRNDVGVGTAPAEIAAHPFPELGFQVTVGGHGWSTSGELVHHADRRGDLPGCAVTALETVVFDEGALHRVQLAVLGQPVGSGDLGSVERHRQHQAAVDPAVAEQHGAGPALPSVAPLLRTGD